MNGTTKVDDDSLSVRLVSDTTSSDKPCTASDPPLATAAHDSASLWLSMSLRRSSLGIVVTLVVALLSGFVVAMWSGWSPQEFNRGEKTSEEEERLLDRYNSYSGNAASLIGRPLEQAVMIITHITVLWCMPDSVMTVDTKRRVQVALLVLSGGLGFLLTNGLNALNVQLREAPVTMVMSSSDLAVNESFVNSSTMAYSFSEYTPRNPTTNTVLRSLVAPRTTAGLKCEDSTYTLPDDSITFGIPQRPWMKHLIQEALPASTVRIDIRSNATTSTTGDFPMNASEAADLLITAVSTHRDYAPFAAVTPYLLPVDYKKWYDPPAGGLEARAARLTGLLPPNPNSTETEDRTSFLAKIALFMRVTTASEWQSRKLQNWTLDISRIKITPSVWVDAITIEMTIASNGEYRDDNGSIYLQNSQFGISPAHLSMALKSAVNPRIDAFSACQNSRGSDALYLKLFNGSRPDEANIVCANTSTSSLFVIGASSYFTADSITDNRLVTDSGVEKIDDRLLLAVKDPHVTYSVTFARISWHFDDLAKTFGAKCDDPRGCLGLDAALPDSNQRLLVSADKLPLDRLTRIDYNNVNYFPAQQRFELVSIRRATDIKTVLFSPKQKGALDNANAISPLVNGTEPENADYIGINATGLRSALGDVLLPHNIQRVEVDVKTPLPSNCSRSIERRTNNYVNNHLYMENSLQATYTAATYFVFQDGATREVVATESSGSIELNLDGNIQKTRVWVSVPTINMILTLVGCVVLAAIQIAAVARPTLTDASKPWTTDPHQIARVIVDNVTFPPSMLKMSIGRGERTDDAEELIIDHLKVRQADTTQ